MPVQTPKAGLGGNKALSSNAVVVNRAWQFGFDTVSVGLDLETQADLSILLQDSR